MWKSPSRIWLSTHNTQQDPPQRLVQLVPSTAGSQLSRLLHDGPPDVLDSPCRRPTKQPPLQHFLLHCLGKMRAVQVCHFWEALLSRASHLLLHECARSLQLGSSLAFQLHTRPQSTESSLQLHIPAGVELLVPPEIHCITQYAPALSPQMLHWSGCTSILQHRAVFTTEICTVLQLVGVCSGRLSQPDEQLQSELESCASPAGQELVRLDQYVTPLKTNKLGPTEAQCFERLVCLFRTDSSFLVTKHVSTPHVSCCAFRKW